MCSAVDRGGCAGGRGDGSTDSRSHEDPVEQLYDARIRGVCLISTRADRRMHLHGGCWVTPAAHRPPRMLVAFPKEFEGAALVREGGDFAVSLIADDQWALHERLFAGRHTLDALGRQCFLRAPSGCPVLGDGVGYFDCRLVEAVDLGDFLLAVGDVRAAAVLHPEKRNLTVNEILRRGLPGEPQLPFRAFNDTGTGLAAARGERADGAVLDAVYAYRQWGLFLVAAGDRLHVGSWAIQCSHQPPRMLVCIDRGLPDTDLVRARGHFGLSLLAEDQLALALDVEHGATTPRALQGARWLRTAGCAVLEDAVAHFVCAVEGEFNAGADCAVFHGPVVRFAWGRRTAPQLRADQLAGADAAG